MDENRRKVVAWKGDIEKQRVNLPAQPDQKFSYRIKIGGSLAEGGWHKTEIVLSIRNTLLQLRLTILLWFFSHQIRCGVVYLKIQSKTLLIYSWAQYFDLDSPSSRGEISLLTPPQTIKLSVCSQNTSSVRGNNDIKSSTFSVKTLHNHFLFVSLVFETQLKQIWRSYIFMCKTNIELCYFSTPQIAYEYLRICGQRSTISKTRVVVILVG